MAKSPSKNRKKKKSFTKSVLDAGIFLLCVLIITYLMSSYVVERDHVRNISMEPTLNNGDSILIDKITYRFRNPKRNEIIVFHQSSTGEDLIKRVIGLPHENICIRGGEIFIDGEKLDDIDGLEIPEYAGIAADGIDLMNGEYFVLGDNREESVDSRYEEVGIVTETRIKGRLFLRLTPISKIKFF